MIGKWVVMNGNVNCCVIFVDVVKNIIVLLCMIVVVLNGWIIVVFFWYMVVIVFNVIVVVFMCLYNWMWLILGCCFKSWYNIMLLYFVMLISVICI